MVADSAAAEAILRQERLFDRMLVRCLSTHSERAVHLKVLTLALFRSNYLYQLKILLLVNPYLVTFTLFDVHPKATEGLRVRDPPPIDTVPSANSNLPTISNNSNNPNTSNNSDGPNSSENPSSSNNSGNSNNSNNSINSNDSINQSIQSNQSNQNNQNKQNNQNNPDDSKLSDEILNDFYRMLFSVPGLVFPILRDLRFSISSEDDFDKLIGLLQRMPNLRSLELKSGRPARAPQTLGTLDRAIELPLLPGLQHFSIEHMTEPLSAILCSVLAKAPNLKHLALNGKWKPTPSHSALIAMREHRGLEAVSWFSPSRTPVVSLFKGNTLPNLTTLGELRHDFGEDKEGLMDVSDALRFRSSSPHLTSIMLQTVLLNPCVAKVKKYVVQQDARPTLASYAGVEAEPSTGSWHDEDVRPQPYIETVFAISLRLAPDLVEVHFGHKYEGGYFPTHRRPTPLDGNLEAYEPWGWLKPTISPKDWERLGWRGVIIRTYKNPADQKRELSLFRILSRSSTAGVRTVGGRAVRQTYVSSRRKWTTRWFYRGYELNKRLIGRACELGDIPYAFLEGERGLTSLPAAAWEMLDDVIAKQHQAMGLDEGIEQRRFDDPWDDMDDDQASEWVENAPSYNM